MSARLKLNPEISYMLGIYACNKGGQAIQLRTRSDAMAEKFAKIALDELGVLPSRILVEKDDNETRVFFYHSKLRKMLQKALERREHLFKYSNTYSANYFAALFDCVGGRDRKSLYLKGIEPVDYLILERLGVHCTQDGSKSRIASAKAFIGFIKDFSIRIRERAA